jgi:Zn-dependent protease with chaperone function
MNFLLRLVFVSLYSMGGIYLLIQSLHLLGVPHSPSGEALIYMVWLGACFTSCLWAPVFYLATQRVRMPVLEEETWLWPLLQELGSRARISSTPTILILEQTDINAYAIGIRTIVLSRGLLMKLNIGELQAVLAHEYGHLLDKDTLPANAFSIAGWIPSIIYTVTRKIIRAYLNGEIILWVISALTLVILVLKYKHLIPFVCIAIIFILLFPFLYTTINLCWCYFQRRCEFRQDEFAFSMGFGRHLKRALLKIDALNSENMVSRLVSLYSSHPLLSQRIRRLEWLEGLRATF